MSLIYGSVCSGIEAATQAWHPLGWKASFFSEIDKFPRAVLQHHYPDVPLHGDFTTIKAGMYDPIELLVGGTPCQSFSVAGLRGGMDDDRGNLALEYLKLAERLSPRWLVWENVPGVLSSNEGKDFGSFLGGLVELGYGFSWRIFNAQYFGVPQRRRRVFVIGYLGDWRPPAAVLFERESLRRNPPPSRKEKQDVAGTITAGLGHRRGAGQEPGSLVPAVSHTLTKSYDAGEDGTGRGTPIIPTTHRMRGFGDYEHDTVASALKSRDYKDATDLVCVHGTQDPCVSDQAFALGRNNGRENAIAFVQNSRDEVRIQGGDGQIAGALSANEGMKQRTYISIQNATRGKDQNGLGISEPDAPMYTLDQASQHAVHQSAVPINTQMALRGPDTSNSFREGVGIGEEGDPAFTLQAAHSHAVQYQSAVRRLTPIECERLQGFKDAYTAIPWRNKPADKCPDGPRYKAIGNSMAVPVMYWLGERIEMVNLAMLK